MKKTDTAAICGLYCKLCPAYPEECGGCLSDNVAEYCRTCRWGLKECATEKGYTRCNECSDYADCERLKNFSAGDYPHRAEVFANLKRINELGIENWMDEQAVKNTCPACGELMQWDRDDCHNCGIKKI